jgi:hypothetical protein
MIWLVGESGAGKSSLLRGGILPLLRRDATKLPIYVDDWGDDWIAGPRYAVVDALNEACREAFGPQYALINDISRAFQELGTLRSRTGRLPIAMFDQFDDYQARHRTKFVVGRQPVISANALAQRNEFWRDISDLQSRGLIGCIFATRDDAAWALECVRFVEPLMFHLDRLARGVVLPLLEELTADDVVTNPSGGWERLKQELCADLESKGSVLPIQMKLAFRSLVGLKSLTPGEYRRNGSLRGLEARYIEDQVSEAAHHFEVDSADLRLVLLSMVDRVSETTVPVTRKIVLASATARGGNGDKIEKALQHLEDKEIVRRRIDPATRSVAWLLDHDYLCRGVLESDQRASPWQHVLNDAVDKFRAARGPFKRWKALLPPWTQFRLLVERVRGRITYRQARGFASLSTAKIFINLPIVIVVAAFFAWAYLNTQEVSRQILSSIGVGTDVTTAQALWKLSQSSYHAKTAVLTQAVTEEGSASWFLKRSPQILNATVGMNSAMRERAIHDVEPRCLARNFAKGLATDQACVDVILYADSGSPEAIRWILGGLQHDTKASPTPALEEALVAVAARIPPSRARGTFNEFVQAAEKNTYLTALPALKNAMVAVAEKMSVADEHSLFLQLLNAASVTTGGSTAMPLSNGMTLLAERFDKPNARSAYREVMRLVEHTPNSWAVLLVDTPLSTIVARLDNSDVQLAGAELTEAMRKTTDGTRWIAYWFGLCAAAPRMSSPDVRSAFRELILVFQKFRNPKMLAIFGERLSAVADKLSDADAHELCAGLLSAMRKTSDDSQLALLEAQFATVARKANEPEAREAFV